MFFFFLNYQLQSKVILRLHKIFHFSTFLTVCHFWERTNIWKNIYFTDSVSSNLVISVDIFWAEIYRGRHFLGPNELKLSPLSKLGYAIFFQVKTTTHFIRLTPVELFIGCFFFFVQLNNYINNLSLLKYFIQQIYGMRDISQQVVTLSKFSNARI